jgi:DNA-binding GntR family transcriptional regulator
MNKKIDNSGVRKKGVNKISGGISIFDELKLAIIKGEFKPRERLLEKEIAERFGVSRTPIREAFRQLENIGMLQINRNQGAKVADFSKEDIESLYRLRIYLEKLAAILACERASSREIITLVGLNREFGQVLSSDDFFKIANKDQEFHFAICKLSGNPFLYKVIEDLRLKSDWFRYHYWKDRKNLKVMKREHSKMIEALKKRDGNQLSSLIETQLEKAKDWHLINRER